MDDFLHSYAFNYHRLYHSSSLIYHFYHTKQYWQVVRELLISKCVILIFIYRALNCLKKCSFLYFHLT